MLHQRARALRTDLHLIKIKNWPDDLPVETDAISVSAL